MVTKLEYLNLLEERDNYETNVSSEQKYFVTFPYPYMNGKLHLGHIYSISKADFMAYYKRMCGYNVLFPFSFHCTGMPISASAKKLKEELEGKSVDVSVSDILKQFGYKDVSPFVDPVHWVRTFPKYAKETLVNFQGRIDWRRSFITTSINPYYDSFVKFQFNKLRKKQLLAFGKRYSILCPIDEQACLDHDRRKGEGVKPVEVILKKIVLGDSTVLLRCRLNDAMKKFYSADVEKIACGTDSSFKMFVLNGRSFVLEDALYRNIVWQVNGIESTHDVSLNEFMGMLDEYAVTILDIEVAPKAQLAKSKTEDLTMWEEYERILKVRNEKLELVESENFVKIYEPESPVISRSGGKCVVSLLDQWYIDYGNEEWKKEVRRCVDKMEMNSATRLNIVESIEWINKWGFSRSFGLGTTIPWDSKYLIDSLSDSTIYMSFYTFKHLLFRDIEGHDEILPSSVLGDDMWEYIYGGVMEDCVEEIPARLEEHRGILEACRKSLSHFYPVDLRVSGKDLIGNHLIFFIFNHVALFQEEFWPTRIFTNGHLMLNSAKMSKSEGNFLSADDALRKFGASATRMCLASCGDTNEDANFEEENANAFVLKLYSLAKNIESLETACITDADMEAICAAIGVGGMTNENRSFCGNNCSGNSAINNDEVCCCLTNSTVYGSFVDSILLQYISHNTVSAVNAYEAMCYRDVVKFAFYENLHVIEQYINQGGSNETLIGYSYKTILQLIYPLVPSFSFPLLKKKFGGDISLPKTYTSKKNSIEAMEYVKLIIYRIITGANGRKSCTITVNMKYPLWKVESMAAIDKINKVFVSSSQNVKIQKAEIIAKLSPLFKLHKVSIDKGLRFVMDYHKDPLKYAITFDEEFVLNLMKNFIEKNTNMKVTFVSGNTGEPMKPTILFS